MKPVPGTILLSTPQLDDPNFEKAVIFICANDVKGAMGFVINKVYPRTFNELAAYRYSPAVALFAGGPVEKESLYFIHCRPHLIKEGNPVNGQVFLGGDFEEAVSLINHQNLQPPDIKLFIGYCGWDANELETEIEEGSWLITTAAIETAFETNTATLWQLLYGKVAPHLKVGLK